jgi:hypothetical protein
LEARNRGSKFIRRDLESEFAIENCVDVLDARLTGARCLGGLNGPRYVPGERNPNLATLVGDRKYGSRWIAA